MILELTVLCHPLLHQLSWLAILCHFGLHLLGPNFVFELRFYVSLDTK